MTARARPLLLLVLAALIGGGLWALWTLDPGGRAGTGQEHLLVREIVPLPSLSGETDVAIAAIESDGGAGGALREAGRTAALDPPLGDPSLDGAAEPGPQLVARLRYEAGQPIEGATFFASTGRSQTPLGFDLGPSAAADIAMVRSDQAGQVTVGPVGEAPRLAPGRTLEVFIRADGCAATRLTSARMTSAEPHDLGVITLPAGARVAGRVLGPGGQPAVGARVSFGQPDARGAVSVRMPGRGLPLAPTDDQGRFACSELRPGAFYIVVETDTSPAAIAYGEADLLAPIESLLITLDRGYVISGRLEGAPEGLDLAVEARRTDDSNPTALERRPRYVPIDASGDFRGDGFAADAAYRLAVVVLPGGDGADRAGTAREVEPVVVPSGTPDAKLEWSTRASVLGRVVLESLAGSTPVESYVIWRANGSPEGSTFDASVLEEDGEPKLSHPGGRFAFEGLGVDRGGSREITLRVRAAGFEERILRGLSVPHAAELDLGDVVLVPAPTWQVSVVDDDTGAPIEAARVFAAGADQDRAFRYWWRSDQPAWSSDSMRFALADAGGVATLMLPTGGTPFRLGVRADGFAPSELLEPPSAVPMEVRLHRGATVEVLVVEEDGSPAAGVDVTLGSADRSAAAPIRLGLQADEEGRVTFSSIPEGRHYVAASPPSMRPRQPRSWGESRVDVTTVRGETAEVTLTTPTFVRVSGLVRQSGVPLPGARVSFQIRDGSKLLSPDWNSTALRSITGGGGLFELERVPLAEYEVVVTHGTRAMATRVPFRVRPGSTKIVIDLPDASVSGRVVLRGTDDALRGVQVQVRDRRDEARAMIGERVLYESESGRVRSDDRWSEPGRVETDRDGGFAFDGLATGVRLTLSVEGPLIRAQSVDLGVLDPGQERRDLLVEVDAAGSITVTFERDASSSRRPRTLVRCWRLDDAGAKRGRPRDQNGRRSVTLQSLRPGRYLIETYDAAERQNPGAAALESQQVSVVALERTSVRMRGK